MDNRRDSEHIIVNDVKLKCNGVLHRFTNHAGAPYSAIYSGDYEYYSCPREDEEKMIKYWNESQGERT